MTNTERPARILYVSGFAEVVGGGQRSFFLLLENLDRSRVLPIVLCPGPGEVSGYVSAMGIRTHFLAQPPLRTWKLWRLAKYVFDLRRLVQRSGADLVHCDTLNSAVLAGTACLFSGTRVILHARVSDSGGILDVLSGLLCDAVICVSGAARERFRSSSKARVIYNGVDTAVYAPGRGGTDLRRKWGVPEDAPILGYCGQLVGAKGLELLLESFPRIKKRVPAARLALAGRGELESALRARVEALGLSDSVIFAGYLERTAPFMAAIDALALPSMWKEGLSRVLIEAMASEKPVVASEIGGNPEVVRDGEEGFLVPVGDAAALVERSVSLLADSELAVGMGRKGRRTAIARFDIKRTALDIQALYDELTGRAGAPAKAPRI